MKENESTNRNERIELPVIESRRGFLGQCLGALAGVTLAGCGAVLISGCQASTVAPTAGGTVGGTTPLSIDVSSLTADESAFVTSQRGPDGKHILIVHRTGDEYLALSMECTHLQNEVAPPAGGTITCPYHGSQFDLSGAVKSGPAAAPLRRYSSTYDPGTKKLTVKFT